MTISMTDQFRSLHAGGTFVLPNPWDVGSALLLQSLGFEALATTSAGHASVHGRLDQAITLEELLAHAEDLIANISIPLNLDSERCFADTPEGVAENVRRFGEVGAAGCSIEDYSPATAAIDDLSLSVERVTAAAEAAKASGMVLTARTENHLYGIDDLDDTVDRLTGFAQAGAEVIYAPGLTNPDAIAAVVAVGAPVNVLAVPSGPSVPELAALGVRRVSTGSSLARACQGALMTAGRELLEAGTSTYTAGSVTSAEVKAAFS